MKNISAAFKTELNNDRRNYIKSCDITLSDGTKLSIDNRHIWNNGFKVEDAVSSENSFDIGSAIVGKFTLIINNIYDDFSEYDFTDAVVSNVRIGLRLPDDTVESVKKGIYTVDEAYYNGSVITLECLDNMVKFDRSYSESNLAYPATLGAIVRDACSCCGVSLAADSAAFDNNNFVVKSRPDDNNLTFRQVLLWVGQISCHWCECNADGQLSLRWYDMVAYEKAYSYDGGILPKYAGKTVDAGRFENSASTVLDAGTFEDRKRFHHIYSFSSMNIFTDDVVITGIRVICEETVDTDEEGATGDTKDVVYQSGQAGYVLSVEGNKLIQEGKGSEVAEYLGNKLNGLRFRPLSTDCLSDPSIEAGDIAFVTDRKGNSYATLITNVTFQSGNYEKISCGAESPRRKSADRYSETTRIYQELRKKLSHNKTEWEKAVNDLIDTLASSSGLFITTEEQEDGSSIYYMHNKNNLSESDIVWKITAEAFGISTDGGKTYPFGFKVTGEMITKILNTIGINAEWINTGAITAKDSKGNVTFSVDVNTGKVIIHADEFSLTGKSISEVAQEGMEDYVNSVVSDAVKDVSTQHFGNYVPKLTNIPASDWTTAELKEAHLNDLFYNTSTKKTYRFIKSGTTYLWENFNDPDIQKALEDASEAKDTADGKRRVFVSTPTPPYDQGDMWLTSTTNGQGAIKVCKTSRASGSCNSSDWIEPKYTDDSSVIKLDKKLNSTEEIFNRLTQNGSIKGIFMKNGQLYFSFNYAQGGVLKLGGANNGNGTLQILDSYDNVIGSFNNSGLFINKGEINGPKIIANEGIIAGMNLTEQGLEYGTNALIFGPIESHSSYVGRCGFASKYEGNSVQLCRGRVYLISDSNITGYISSGNGTYDAPVNTLAFYNSTDGVMLSISNSWAKFFSYISEFLGSVTISGNLSVTGTKNRLVKTKNYGDRLMYCYETASPYFGDMGFGETDETGVCLVEMDDIFQETVGTQEYLVLLQAEGEGELYVKKNEKHPQYFVVRGTPNLSFAWEVKCYQGKMQYVRLGSPEEEDMSKNQETTEDILTSELAKTEKEMEELAWKELTN